MAGGDAWACCAESERMDVSKVFESAQPSTSLASVKLRVAYAVAHPPPSPVREDSAGEQQALRAQVCSHPTLRMPRSLPLAAVCRVTVDCTPPRWPWRERRILETEGAIVPASNAIFSSSLARAPYELSASEAKSSRFAEGRSPVELRLALFI